MRHASCAQRPTHRSPHSAQLTHPRSAPANSDHAHYPFMQTMLHAFGDSLAAGGAIVGDIDWQAKSKSPAVKVAQRRQAPRSAAHPLKRSCAAPVARASLPTSTVFELPFLPIFSAGTDLQAPPPARSKVEPQQDPPAGQYIRHPDWRLYHHPNVSRPPPPSQPQSSITVQASFGRLPDQPTLSEPPPGSELQPPPLALPGVAFS